MNEIPSQLLEHFKILYQDESYIVVNKPAPMLVHRTEGDKDRFNLLKLVRDSINQFIYPIHRLDKQASGAIIFGLNQDAVRALQELWPTEKVKKEYTALVKGEILEAGVFNFPLSDENKVPKEAITFYKPIEHFPSATLVEVEIHTGRYHQIRRHFSRRMQAIIGDRRYGKKTINDQFLNQYGLSRLFLHSHRLSFWHPFTEKWITVEAPLQQDLLDVLQKMRLEK